LNNTITDVLQEYEIHPGDVFFLPAGRVHSIGAGAFIAEIPNRNPNSSDYKTLSAVPLAVCSPHRRREKKTPIKGIIYFSCQY
jgi:ribosomal protein L16 Arg81 hydroxylase